MKLKWFQLYAGKKRVWWVETNDIKTLCANPRAVKVHPTLRDSSWGQLRFPPHDCILYIKDKTE